MTSVPSSFANCPWAKGLGYMSQYLDVSGMVVLEGAACAFASC